MDRRTDELCNFKRRLGVTLHDVTNTKEQIALQAKKDLFEGEDFKSK